MTCTLFPAVLAVAALGLGVAGRRAPSERGVSTLAILVAVAYLGLLAIGVGFAVWTNRPKPRRPAAASTGPPLTDAEVRAFADELAASLGRGDPTLFDRRFDREGLIDRAFVGLELSDAARDGALRGFEQQVGALGRQVAQSVHADGGSYTLLRVRRDGGRPTLLFRMLGEAGVNYHELTLRRGADGAPMFDDVHVFLGGVRMSAILRRLGSPEGEREMLDAGRIAELVRQGDPRGALRFHDGLQRTSKDLLIMRLAAAQAVGPEEVARTIELLERTCPDEPGVQLLLLDTLLERGELARGVRILEALDASVEGDPFLLAMQANILVASGDLAGAKQRARAATEREPTLHPPVLVLLSISLGERDHSTTRALLERLEADFGEDRGGLAQDPEFADFVASPEHAAWLAGRRPAPRGADARRTAEPPR